MPEWTRMNATTKLTPGMRVRILGQRIGDSLMGLTLRTDTGTVVGPDASDMDYFLPGCGRVPRPIICIARIDDWVGLAMRIASIEGSSKPSVRTRQLTNTMDSPPAKRPRIALRSSLAVSPVTYSVGMPRAVKHAVSSLVWATSTAKHSAFWPGRASGKRSPPPPRFAGAY